MATSLVVACTHCGSRLKLKEASFLGKKLRCPKCQQAFVAQTSGPEKPAAAAKKKPTRPADDFNFLDDLGEEDYEAPPSEGGDDMADLPPLPVKKAKGKTAAKGKKRRASSGPGAGKVALIAGLVVLGLAVVAGGVYGIVLIVQSLGGGGGRLAWLPEDSEIVCEIRVADLWNSPVLQPLTTSQVATSLAEQWKSVSKLNVTDVERVVVGGSMQARSPVVVVYSKVPIPLEEIRQNTTEVQHNGYTLYMDRTGPSGGFLPNATTLVFGPEAMLKAAIDRKGAGPPAERFRDLPSGGQIIVASSNPAAARPPGGSMNLPAEIDLNSVRFASAVLSFTADIGVQFNLTCTDAPFAQKIVTDIEQGRTQALAQLETQRGQLVPNPFIDVTKLRAMLDSQQQILESVTVSNSGASVTGKLTVPGKLISDAADALGPMMPMMMQAFQQGASTPVGSESAPSSLPVRTTAPAGQPGGHAQSHSESSQPAGQGSAPPGGHGEFGRPPAQSGAPPGGHGEGGRPPAHGGAPPGGHGEFGRPPGQGGAPPGGHGEGGRPPAQGGAPPVGHGEFGRPPGQGGAPPGGHGEGGRPPAQGGAPPGGHAAPR